MRRFSTTARYRSVRPPIKLALTLIFAVALVAGSPARSAETVILGFGDSLMAGYELAQDESFPAQLEDRLQAQGHDVRVINAGVSGETTAGGRARLDWALGAAPGGKPDLVILELGANDALRGLDPALTRDNLDAMLAALTARDIPVLLAGMLAPPNMGADYEAAFNAAYPALAEKYGVPLYPFFLDGVAADPALNQDDGIHPTADGVAVIVEGITPYVERALEAAREN